MEWKSLLNCLLLMLGKALLFYTLDLKLYPQFSMCNNALTTQGFPYTESKFKVYNFHISHNLSIVNCSFFIFEFKELRRQFKFFMIFANW